MPSRPAPATSATVTRAVALIGNPNTGKTSLFNALTGFQRHIANYPGVTVEAAHGPLRDTRQPIEIIDLPGTYSLAALSPDEQLVTNLACGRLAQQRPDAVLAIIDATNLQRNLYLLSQVMELGLPVVVALNMMDVAARRGLKIDAPRLSRQLGVPVVPVIATQPRTVQPLVHALEKALQAAAPGAGVSLPAALKTQVERLVGQPALRLQRAEAIRALLDAAGPAEAQYTSAGGDVDLLSAARTALRAAGIDAAAEEARARHAWSAVVLQGVVSRSLLAGGRGSEAIDAYATHWLLGPLLLAGVLFVLFQSIFAWAGPLMDLIDGGFAWAAAAVSAQLPPMLGSLVADGIIAGVGGVLVFLPQIMILFAFIAVLEDCGYLARAAYMMDRLMNALGLSGRAFVPLLSSFACAIPAIMSTRTISDRRERFVTILLAPFMSCSARLPVYVLFIGVFVPKVSLLGGWVGLQGLTMMAMYLVGVVVAIPLAWLLRTTVFRGAPSTFVMELPGYRVPRLRAVWQRMHSAGRSFVLRAGSVILALNLVVWALAYFPRDARVEAHVRSALQAASLSADELQAAVDGAYLRDSYLGRLGHAIEPVIAPLGWDWRIGVAVLASFPAREVIVSTLGMLYNLGGDVDEEAPSLHAALAQARWPDGRPVFTLPVAISIMVFFALCAQCSSTLVTMGREMRSVMWPVASFVTMTLLAYGAAWLVIAVWP